MKFSFSDRDHERWPSLPKPGKFAPLERDRPGGPLVGEIHSREEDTDGQQERQRDWLVTMTDLVNHPPHYTAHPSGVECIDVIETLGCLVANAIKYLWRTDYKNGLEDLEKARWYAERELNRRSEDHRPVGFLTLKSEEAIGKWAAHEPDGPKRSAVLELYRSVGLYLSSGDMIRTALVHISDLIYEEVKKRGFTPTR